MNVPSNFVGYQQAHSGVGYAGVITYHWDIKEYIQAQLNAPLIVGQRAYVSLFVSPGGFAPLGNISPELLSSGIGLRMSVEPFPVPDDWIQYDLNAAIVHMDEVLQDTATWTRLYTEFTPDSSCQYIQLGNFFAEDSTLGVEVDPDGGGVYAYAFIDDVCISQMSGVCDGTQLVQSHEGTTDGFHVIGLPDGHLYLTLPTGWQQPIELAIYDATGHALMKEVPITSDGAASVAPFTHVQGIYLARICDALGRMSSRLFFQP